MRFVFHLLHSIEWMRINAFNGQLSNESNLNLQNQQNQFNNLDAPFWINDNIEIIKVSTDMSVII